MKRELNLSLPTADSLFSLPETSKDEKIIHLSLPEIDSHPDNPFEVRMDAKMVETVESIAQYGVLVPAIVRPAGDGRYQMIAGHRRKEGCEINGLVTIPYGLRSHQRHVDEQRRDFIRRKHGSRRWEFLSCVQS